ncbi:MAG: hypothetical protein AAF715_25710 [Myxococcota bacterium]
MMSDGRRLRVKGPCGPSGRHVAPAAMTMATTRATFVGEAVVVVVVSGMSLEAGVSACAGS